MEATKSKDQQPMNFMAINEKVVVHGHTKLHSLAYYPIPELLKMDSTFSSCACNYAKASETLPYLFLSFDDDKCPVHIQSSNTSAKNKREILIEHHLTLQISLIYCSGLMQVFQISVSDTLLIPSEGEKSAVLSLVCSADTLLAVNGGINMEQRFVETR